MKKLLFFALALLLAACEKPAFNETTGKEIPSETNVILHFTQYEQEAFSRSATDITNLCSRLNIAIFDAEGTKVKTVAQKEGDASYGTVALSLAAGTYCLVVIAHNCDGSATITSTEKVTFPNNKVTDTFFYYGTLVVTDALQSYTFSPKAGYGCVNSKQTEIRPVSTDGIYEIYTLPHTEEDVLTKLTVTALDANDDVIMERTFENIPIIRNQVTLYTGSFFGSGGTGDTGSGTFRLTADPDWDSVNGYTF